MQGEQRSAEIDREDKRAHLGHIQGVVNRLSTNSFLLKGWSVILVTSLFALAANGSNVLFVYLAYFPALAFWSLDGYFLWQERLFRKLYDHVRQRDHAAIDYCMNTSLVNRPPTNWWGATRSMTLVVFHGSLVLTIFVVMFIIIFLSK